MNGVAVMMDSPVFREVMAEMVVGLNLFDSAYGNEFNDGIRFAAKWIFDNIALNEDVPEEQREQFVLECGRKYVRDKAQKARKIDDVPVFDFNQ